MVFFSKKVEIFEIDNFIKIPSFTIYFISYFIIFLFIRRNRDFINKFWKFLKVLLQKQRYVKYFFPKFRSLLFVFFYFSNIFHIFFSISSICTCQKILKIFMFFYFIRDFVNDFLKVMERFSKKYRHLKFKIIQKFHYLLFVFF